VLYFPIVFLPKRDTGESIEEEEKGVEVNIGNCVTEEEEDGTVTVLKLSNGGMFRVPIPIHLHSLPCGVHNHFLTDWWGRVQ
jgi:hypothetical protein